MKYLFILCFIASLTIPMNQENMDQEDDLTKEWLLIERHMINESTEELVYIRKPTQNSIAKKQKKITFFQKSWSQMGHWANRNPGTSSLFFLGGTFSLGAISGAASLYLYQRLQGE